MAYRIGIVNDLALAREALVRTVALVPDGTVAWIAKDGDEAVAKCATDRPDLVLMDLVMPRMAGVEATRKIMRESPCAVLVVTATVEGNAVGVYEAISAGAIDAVDTPRLDATGRPQATRILEKVAAIRALERAAASEPTPIARPAPPAPPPVRKSADDCACPPLLLIGASTGGPQAIAELLRLLAAAGDPGERGDTSHRSDPSDRVLDTVATVIVQHMDERFIGGFVDWLGGQVGVPIRQLAVGETPRPGDIVIAGGTTHTAIGPSGAFAALKSRPADLHVPSIDALFSSAASVGASRGAAVLLTGMGRDGARGLKELRSAGWATFAQDKASSVVWGMPREAERIGAVDQCHPIGLIARSIRAALRGHQGTRAVTRPEAARKDPS